MDAGADFIITQLFYDVDTFVEWREECRKIGWYHNRNFKALNYFDLFMFT